MSIFRVKLTQGSPQSGSGNLDYVAQLRGVVTAASNTAPIVITSANHGLGNLQKITIAGVTGNTAANGMWTVTVINPNQFSLNNSIGNGAYVSGGYWSSVSIQRTMYCPGPHLTNRVLNDGETFQDCNYWKQFTLPVAGPQAAFIEVVEDDGIPFSYYQETFIPRVYNLTVLNGSDFADNLVDFMADYGVPASSATVTVTGEDVLMQINGMTSADYPLAAGSGIEFNPGELQITSLAFANVVSGGASANVIVLASIPSVCTS